MIFFYIALTMLMMMVVAYDFTEYKIPNKLNLAIILLYPVMLIMNPEPVDWLSGIYALLATFSVGFIIFSFNIMGGGDIKLICANALWCGFSETLMQFILYTALIGGALSLLLIIGRPIATLMIGRLLGAEKVPRVFTDGQPVPYGLAIAPAFLILLLSSSLPSLPALTNL